MAVEKASIHQSAWISAINQCDLCKEDDVAWTCNRDEVCRALWFSVMVTIRNMWWTLSINHKFFRMKCTFLYQTYINAQIMKWHQFMDRWSSHFCFLNPKARLHKLLWCTRGKETLNQHLCTATCCLSTFLKTTHTLIYRFNKSYLDLWADEWKTPCASCFLSYKPSDISQPCL